jgi:hypothetical protein
MPFVQTTYSERMQPAFEGMLHGTDNDVFTGIVEAETTIGFGKAVKSEAGAESMNNIIDFGAAAATFAGITVKDPALGAEVTAYGAGKNAGVLRRGQIWVKSTGAAAVVGAFAYYVPATGVIQANSGGGAVAIAGSRWVTNAAQDGLAVLYIPGPVANA